MIVESTERSGGSDSDLVAPSSFVSIGSSCPSEEGFITQRLPMSRDSAEVGRGTANLVIECPIQVLYCQPGL